jgi:hypothetical protein
MDGTKFSECVKSLRSGSASGLPGIYYITSTSSESENALPKIVSPYYIQNPFNLSGTGWAGSNCYYLTNDSFGNTLEEMNVLR